MPMLRDKSYLQTHMTFSSFMSVEKTLKNVVDLILQNPRLLKLLYYSDKHALGLPAVNQEQAYSLLNSSVRIVPKLPIEPDKKSYIIVGMNNFTPDEGQTTFRSMSLSFDILCDYDIWLLDDFKLRPYAIAGEIDGMINKSFLTNGIADFVYAHELVLNNHLGGITLNYKIETQYDDYEKQKVH